MSETVTLTGIAAFKNLSYVVAFIAASQWLGFNPLALSVLGFLMVMDVMTGVTRAYYVTGGQSIRSSIFKRGIIAKMLLISALISTALAGKGVGFEVHQLAQGFVSVLILGELYSILGNIHSIRSGTVKVEFDAVAWLLEKVKEMLTKILK